MTGAIVAYGAIVAALVVGAWQARPSRPAPGRVRVRLGDHRPSRHRRRPGRH